MGEWLLTEVTITAFVLLTGLEQLQFHSLVALDSLSLFQSRTYRLVVSNLYLVLYLAGYVWTVFQSGERKGIDRLWTHHFGCGLLLDIIR